MRRRAAYDLTMIKRPASRPAYVGEAVGERRLMRKRRRSLEP